jgi:hypothetical protein
MSMDIAGLLDVVGAHLGDAVVGDSHPS